MKRIAILMVGACLAAALFAVSRPRPARETRPERSEIAPETAKPVLPEEAAPRVAQRVGDSVVSVRDAPEQAEFRARQLADPNLDFAARRQAADALAHAQTPAAQVGLRDGIEAALQDPELPVAGKALLAQRLGFVREPDPQTLNLALRLARADPSSLRRAGLMTLGAVARNGGSEAAALGPIRDAVDDADPDERAVGYRALGNLGSPDAMAQLRRAARVESSGRALAGIAQGLGADPSPAGTLALAQLASSAHPPTQLRALTGLIGRKLSSEAAIHLAAAGAPNALFAENASAWTSAAMTTLHEREVRRAAQAMLERGDVGPQVRARLRQALQL